MKKLVSSVLLVLLFACTSNTDTETYQQVPEPQDVFNEINGGSVSTLQFISIPHNNINQNEYVGYIRDIEITLVHNNVNSELVFQMPINVPIGEQKLTINNLGISVNYDVSKTVLEKDPDEELRPFFNSITDFQSSLEPSKEASDFESYMESFSNFYDGLDNSSKEQLALSYVANIEFYQNAFETDLISKENVVNDDLQILGKLIFYGTSFSFTLYSTFVLLEAAIAAPTPINIGVLALSAYAAHATYTRLKIYNKKLTDRNLKIITVVLDNINSLFDKNNNEPIKFISSKASTFKLNSERRHFISSDNDGSNQNISDYFNLVSSISSTIDKFNSIINFIKEYSPFSSVLNVDSIIINNENSTEISAEDEVFYNLLDISLEGQSASIDDISFSNGDITISISINPNDGGLEFLETQLNLNYQDDFNHLNGFYPIEIYDSEQLKNAIRITDTDEVLDYSIYDLSVSGNCDTQCVLVRTSDFDGNGLNLYLERPLEDGTYQFDFNENGSWNTFFIQFWHSNLSYGALPEMVFTTAGTMNVSNNGTKFDFNCEGELSNNPTTKLSFRGNLSVD